MLIIIISNSNQSVKRFNFISPMLMNSFGSASVVSIYPLHEPSLFQYCKKNKKHKYPISSLTCKNKLGFVSKGRNLAYFNKP